MSSIEEKTRRDVERQIERLREKYGEFELVETSVSNEPDRFEKGVEIASEGWRGDAGAWIVREKNEKKEVLLIRHPNNTEVWGNPGGGHEPGESFEETARREVKEETGVDISLRGVFKARKKEFYHEDDPERRAYMLTVVFEAEYEGGETSAEGDDEVLKAKWFPKDSLPELYEFIEEEAKDWVKD